MTGSVPDLLALAHDDLVVARRDRDGGFSRHAASRAYYAVFHAAVAALAARGERPKTHAGVRTRFGALFVQGGPFEKRHSRTLDELARLRNDADYHVGREVGADAAREAVADAEAFVADVAAWVEAQ
ncbi:HEPN domain-containing protein [Rubrivirga litoralis]|uniref:HEPN domain-containing protein n=1 Tax=Rubrivirga litoralis TaxID=3075598 RepID=A0ABU3BU78_9BACT|nr:HEPN domain-containing protein [Rubrivirga sp. F394]MDT0632847.1 HEPN domain-containing protein [Rubrivirga sp. F394]